jgi:hypothetical protein
MRTSHFTLRITFLMFLVKVMKFHFGFIWSYNVPTQTSIPTSLMWTPFTEIHLTIFLFSLAQSPSVLASNFSIP